MKKVWLGLAAAAGVVFVAGVILPVVIFLLSGRYRPKEYVQTRTEVEPIYNHFPELPETAEIQWCSRTTTSIGPSTVQLYIFAFYDHDISGALQDMDIDDQNSVMELYYSPDSISENEKWREVQNAPTAFQTGIKDTEKMYTTVYINDTGTILYVEAIGD